MYPFKWRELNKDEEYDGVKINSKECLKVDEPNGLVLPRRFAENIAKKTYSMEVYEDDIWVVSFPKCGTTWTQEIVWSMVTKIDPDTKDELINTRFAFLEYPSLIDQSDYDNFAKDTRPFEEQPVRAQTLFHTHEHLKRMKRPRFIKSHLPFAHLPPDLLNKAKVFYVSRNPFDAFISYFFHLSIGGRLKMSIEEFFRVTMKGNNHFGDFMEHMKQGWALRNHPNVCFLWYEEMKADFDKALDKIAGFLGIELDDDFRQALWKRTNINEMRSSSVKKAQDDDRKEYFKQFFRSGKSGDWKNHLKDPEVIKEMEDYVAAKLKGTDIKVPFFS